MHRVLLVIISIVGLAMPAAARPVLMISIDGLRPGDVINAEARGLKLPNLHRFVREGTYAEGVVGVLPTVTYPSHTTLITGTSPGRHGIVNNLAFDPLQINQGGWAWYATDIRVPTLWEAATRSGLKVGSVHWPVSVSARGIARNLPQIWRTGHDDDAKLLTILATSGLVDELEAATSEAYPLGIDESVEGDERRGRFAEALIRRHRPGFLTVYLAGLDHQQHTYGPDTAEAHTALERIDAIVGRLVSAELARYPEANVAVVSDHGFAAVTKETNLFHAFIDEGLITLDALEKVIGWEAMPVPEDGSASVILARPDDAQLQAKVAALLERLKHDPRSGIAAIADRNTLIKLGGDPRASFYVSFIPGTAAGEFGGAKAPLYAPMRSKGTHGYFAAYPEMQSTFLLMGRGVPRGKSLGVIDMRSIAPTLARILGAKLESADLPPLSF